MSSQSTSSRKLFKSHYDTLKINKNSTHEEIKTAYYKLSKEYHPDINQSEDAKKKFQDLSEAYEILGDSSKRKMYDQDLMDRVGHIPLRKATFSERQDLKAKMYQKQRVSQNPFYESNKKPYDFFAWEKAHYGELFNKSWNVKNEKMGQQNEKVDIKTRKKQLILTVLTFTFMILFMNTRSFFLEYDRDTISTKKQKEK